jgi:hypothetical protein
VRSNHLSYKPIISMGLTPVAGSTLPAHYRRVVEPAAFPTYLSGRSNHLSYKPIISMGLTPVAGPASACRLQRLPAWTTHFIKSNKQIAGKPPKKDVDPLRGNSP